MKDVVGPQPLKTDYSNLLKRLDELEIDKFKMRICKDKAEIYYEEEYTVLLCSLGTGYDLDCLYEQLEKKGWNITGEAYVFTERIHIDYWSRKSER